MKQIFRIILISWAWPCASLLAGAPPDWLTQINYQGQLTDSSGLAVSDGSYNITFRIYSHPSSLSPGNLIWGGETQNLNVSKGLFSAYLGQLSPLPDLTPAQLAGDFFLFMQVAGEPAEMLPRQKLLPAFLARSAQSVQGRLPDNTAGNLLVLNGSGAIPDGLLGLPLDLSGSAGAFALRAQNSSSGGLHYGVWGLGESVGVYGSSSIGSGLEGLAPAGTGVKGSGLVGGSFFGQDASPASFGLLASGYSVGVSAGARSNDPGSAAFWASEGSVGLHSSARFRGIEVDPLSVCCAGAVLYYNAPFPAVASNGVSVANECFDCLAASFSNLTATGGSVGAALRLGGRIAAPDIVNTFVAAAGVNSQTVVCPYCKAGDEIFLQVKGNTNGSTRYWVTSVSNGSFLLGYSSNGLTTSVSMAYLVIGDL